MVVLPQARVTCNHYDCKESVNVEYELTSDHRDIPILELTQSPAHDGWRIFISDGRAAWDGNPSCLCPKHRPIGVR